MRQRIVWATLMIATLAFTGCAAGMRVGGEQRGIGAGAAIGPSPAPFPTSSAAPVIVETPPPASAMR